MRTLKIGNVTLEMGTLIVDLESRFLPAIVMGMIILISIPMTVSAVTLICLTTNNKKTEV